MLDVLAILNVVLLDFLELTVWCVELSHKGEWLCSVHLEFRARAVEILVAQSVLIHVTSITINWCNVTITFLAATL